MPDVEIGKSALAFQKIEVVLRQDGGTVGARTIEIGRFIDGFVGEQFALPIAVESLRANRKLPMNGERTVIAAADPLNLVGIIVPGERIPAISGRSMTFRDGQLEPEGEMLAAARM